jgi:hypothetical protein
LLAASFLLGLFFDPEDGGNMFLLNDECLSVDYTALYPRRQNTSIFIILDGFTRLCILQQNFFMGSASNTGTK